MFWTEIYFIKARFEIGTSCCVTIVSQPLSPQNLENSSRAVNCSFQSLLTPTMLKISFIKFDDFFRNFRLVPLSQRKIKLFNFYFVILENTISYVFVKKVIFWKDNIFKLNSSEISLKNTVNKNLIFKTISLIHFNLISKYVKD